MTTTEPAWLTSKADQRLALFGEKIGDIVQGFDVLQMSLTEPSGDDDKSFRRWDQSCDNCDKYLPRGLIVQHIERKLNGTLAIITVGACPDCWDLP